jgi:RHS repeat-associated protein
MPALARVIEDDCYSHAANDACINGGPWTRTKYRYDTAGRVDQVTYPQHLIGATPKRFVVLQDYNATGYLYRLRDAASGESIWQAEAQDALGNVSIETLRNNVDTLRHYDPGTGELTAVDATSPAGQVQSLNYEWNVAGNLKARVDQVQGGLREEFFYDSLNRIWYSQRNGAENLRLTYDDLGNIKTKSDIGTYNYMSGTRPHAPANVTGTKATTFLYDDNGNMTSGGGRSVTWTSFNYPSSASQGGENSVFAYGPDRSMFKQAVSRSFSTVGGDPTNGQPTSGFYSSCTLMTCTFEAMTSSDDRGITWYAWDFGDGQTGSGQNPVHTYETPGAYTVTLRVTDTGGLASQSTNDVFVPGGGEIGNSACSLGILPQPICPPLDPLATAAGGYSGSSTAMPGGTVSEVRTIHYADDLYRREVVGGWKQHVHNVLVGSRTVAVYTVLEDGSAQTRYLHVDHLGSLDAVTDEEGRIVERLSYDAFGKRRVANWTPDVSGSLLNAWHASDDGYTFQKHLDHVSLIHMKGRVYDPIYARFLSADPFVQDHSNLLSLNRYAYTLNNPLTYTDPSGFQEAAITTRADADSFLEQLASVLYIVPEDAIAPPPDSWSRGSAADGLGEFLGDAATEFANGDLPAEYGHRYRLWSPICSGSIAGCDYGYSFRAVDPVSLPFRIIDADSPHEGRRELFGITSSNPVTHRHDLGGGLIVNVALPGHALLGTVTHHVYQQNNLWQVETIGVGPKAPDMLGIPGSGWVRDRFNEWAGRAIFGAQMHGPIRTLVGPSMDPWHPEPWRD